MLPRLYLSNADPNYYNNNGLGFLRDCTKCIVTEELNGAYNLNLTLTPTEPLLKHLIPNNFIKAKPNNQDVPQLFEIIKVEISENRFVNIQANHIKYLACQNRISGEEPIDEYKIKGTPEEIFNSIITDLEFPTTFTFSSDIGDVREVDFSNALSRNLGDLLSGNNNSLLSEFGGEFRYNNFKISLLKSRGKDSGYKLVFGNNFSSYTQTATNDKAYSHYLGFAKVSTKSEKHPTICLSGKSVVTNKEIKFPKLKIIDFTEKIKDFFGSDFKIDTNTSGTYEPVIDKITYFTSEYFLKENKSKTDCEVNIRVTYNSELDKMQSLSLGDTVKVCFSEDSASIVTRITKMQYDSLSERFIEIDVGDKVVSLSSFVTKKRR